MDREAWAARFLDITGDADAARYLVTLFELQRLADDMADGDSADPRRDMARLLTIALVEIPADPFYQRHAPVLHHAMAQAVALWDVSNRWQHADEQRATFGFVHRESFGLLILQVAALCRGWRDAAAIYDDVWTTIWPDRDETVATWRAEE